MSADAFTELCAEIERLMDKHSPSLVVTAVGAVLGEKGDHIRSNWQDEAMALRFEKASEKIAKIAETVS